MIPLGILAGDRLSNLPFTSLAAATTDIYYIPFGGPGAGTAVLTGLFKDVVVKSVQVSGQAAVDLRIREFGIVEVGSNAHIPIMFDDGAICTNEHNDSAPIRFDFKTLVQDARCFYIEIQNASGGSAYSFNVTVTYEPLR